MGCRLNCLDEPFHMVVPKPIQTKFGIHNRLESCDTLETIESNLMCPVFFSVSQRCGDCPACGPGVSDPQVSPLTHFLFAFCKSSYSAVSVPRQERLKRKPFVLKKLFCNDTCL